MRLLLLIILVLMLIGVIPVWPHSRNWGYNPVLVVVILLVVLALMGGL